MLQFNISLSCKWIRPRKDSTSSGVVRKESVGRERVRNSNDDSLKLSDYLNDQLDRKSAEAQYSDTNSSNAPNSSIASKDTRSWHSYLQPLPPTSPSVLLAGSSNSADIDNNLNFLDYYCNVKSVTDESPESTQRYLKY